MQVWIRGLLIVGAGLAPTMLSATTPTRIVSLNLCTDSLLLELAPPASIASLTLLSRNPALSPLAERAAKFPFNHGLAEEVIALAPDLVLAGPATTATTNALLSSLGVRVETFGISASLSDFERDFLRVGALLDRQPYASQLLHAMRQHLQAIPRRDVRDVSALLVQPNGYVPGPHSLANDLLKYAWTNNVAPTLGVPNGGFIALERLVAAPPHWLVISAVDPTQPAHAMDFFSHPALRQAMRASRVVTLPDALWACGGTYFAKGVEQLRTAIDGPR